MTLGRAEDADEAYLRGRAEAERLGSTWALPPFAAFRSILLRWTGRWDEASAEAEAALQLGEELAQPNVAPMAYAVLIDICARRGDLDAARAYRDAGDALLRQGITWTAQFFGWATAALAYAERQLDAAIARLIAGGLDRELLGLIVMDQGPGPEIMRMLIEAGELTRAEKLAAAADRTAHENPDVASLQAGALHCRGLLTRDSDALVEAVALLEDTPFVPALAAACEDAGLASAGSGDRDAAARLLKRAREHQVALGSVHDQARIDRHLRRLGISRRGRPAGTRPRRGWGSLTPAELRIAQLVAAGRSNPDIAEQLFISRYTVESHLKHIFAKLGIGSRAELAARAALHVE
jgi:ATP/maltotriose-dependent transcriptional regulator MalT